MSDMIEVIIDSIRVHLMTPQRVVVFKQASTERYLTIWNWLSYQQKPLLSPYRKPKWCVR